ncbi:sigma-70 family RNA polymerase sigma factor [Niastella caeni]|uniref:Sigma-70 family RNA polymerase sigma factor n=1 Tax=Niastella caeni TaxID=2569763 RepID=A0A4V4GZF2_9BACT|nr:sigma-70 family RNA polymerase sigma factor [Niastella caeni]THU32466.1 sigma-70 family RNA polymerase sigma factor [Niastella caeni]
MHLPHPCNGIAQWNEAGSVAFTNIYNRFYDPLVFFARKLLTDQLAAEDIVTEIFLKYWQKEDQFNSVYAVKAFLYISTRNACINHKQKAQHMARAKADLRVLTDEFDEPVLNAITQAEILRDVYYSVEALPVQCRKIVLYSYFGGLSNKQIARRLQLSVHTVRNQKVRGIQLVRGKVQACL